MTELEFTQEQLDQIEAIHNATKTLLELMLYKPAYLKNSELKGLENYDPLPVAVSEVADLVADHLILHTDCEIFYPTHVEWQDEDYISDVY